MTALIRGAIIGVVLATGCVTVPIAPHDRAIARLNDPLYALAAAVDVIVDTLPPDARDDRVLAEATSGDPALLAPFAGYALKVKIEQETGVILVCDMKTHEALIEDVTCTPRLDTVRPTGSPCEFFLDVGRVCAEDGR